MTFKKTTSIGIVVAAIFFAASSAYAADATVGVSAAIVAPTLTIANTADLDFGTIIPGASAASVLTINATGGPVTGATVLGPGSVTGGASGACSVSSNIDADVTITYTVESSAGTPVADELFDFGTSSTLDFTGTSVTNNSTASPLTVVAGTPGTINVGGALNVANGVTAGNYSGTITVNVVY